MSDKLEFTGERFTPECEREIWYEHVHRYAFATQFCKGATVLDAACGEGYGAAMLAEGAAAVTGVDISEATVAHASARYAHVSNLAFKAADCTDLPFEPGSFDRVVSFETLEHLQAQEDMLAEFRRVLRPDGVLILSSPDKAEYSDRQGAENPFHVRELYRHELEELLSEAFPAFRILGQKLGFYSVIFDEQPQQLTVQSASDGELETGAWPHVPVYFIALCAASVELLPETSGGVWLFDDKDESVYGHYHHEVQKNMKAGGILAAHQARIEELVKELERSSTPWWRRWRRQD